MPLARETHRAEMLERRIKEELLTNARYYGNRVDTYKAVPHPDHIELFLTYSDGVMTSMTYAPDIHAYELAWAAKETLLDRVAAMRATERTRAERDEYAASLTPSQLHEMFAHPGYEYATTEGQRKNWDQIDDPPEGDGWVRNKAAGRNGWERFDYTEESYWMRIKP